MVKLRRVDKNTINDHHFLQPEDDCVYLYEYSPQGVLEPGSPRSRIYNLKKGLDLRGQAQFRYKAKAIREFSQELKAVLHPEFLKITVLVPIPPSKAKSDPLYDDRMLQVCTGVGAEVDVRELLLQNETVQPSHSSAVRMSIEDLISNYKLDESLTEPPPSQIGIVDDMLTTGRHFRAAKHVLSAQFPETKVYGIFLTRRVVMKDADIDWFENLDSLDD